MTGQHQNYIKSHEKRVEILPQSTIRRSVELNGGPADSWAPIQKTTGFHGFNGAAQRLFFDQWEIDGLGAAPCLGYGELNGNRIEDSAALIM